MTTKTKGWLLITAGAALWVAALALGMWRTYASAQALEQKAREVAELTALVPTRPCIDEVVVLRGPVNAAELEKGTLPSFDRIACSHVQQRIVDRFEPNVFLCRCNPEKVLSDTRWVDPLYKQQIEIKYSEASFDYLDKQMNKPNKAPNPPPLPLPDLPHSGTGLAQPPTGLTPTPKK